MICYKISETEGSWRNSYRGESFVSNNYTKFFILCNFIFICLNFGIHHLVLQFLRVMSSFYLGAFLWNYGIYIKIMATGRIVLKIKQKYVFVCPFFCLSVCIAPSLSITSVAGLWAVFSCSGIPDLSRLVWRRPRPRSSNLPPFLFLPGKRSRKKVALLVRQLRGGGGGRTTKEKWIFLKL